LPRTDRRSRCHHGVRIGPFGPARDWKAATGAARNHRLVAPQPARIQGGRVTTTAEADQHIAELEAIIAREGISETQRDAAGAMVDTWLRLSDRPKRFVLPVTPAAPVTKQPQDASIRERASKLIEQGQSVAQAELNARRAIAYERNEPFVATLGDIDTMT